LSYYRFPTTVVLLPVSYFPNALRTHKRTHCERMIRTSLAAAGYHGGRHSWNAELSWVPLRPFDRSPPMGTVLTVDRLSFSRSGLPTFTHGLHTSADIHPWFAHVCRHSPNVCTRLPTFTRCVHTSADIHPMCAHVCRHSPNVCTMLALGSMVVHHAGPGIHGCASCWPWDPWLCTMLARSAMIDLPTIEGTPTRSPPVGTAAAGPARR
jgi:hypothetical protein